MSITVAKSAGFCFGVNRAINIVNSLLDKNVKVSTLGPIIHNMEVVNELESRGCKAVENIDEVEKDATLVIRSHGVPKYVIDKLDENGVKYEVDVKDGQKTGFFLDQKYNRLAIQRLCKGKKVLDCFTHMGTFALNAGIAGAADDKLQDSRRLLPVLSLSC